MPQRPKDYLETETPEHIYSLFKNLFFINFLLTSYTSVGMFIVGNELITIWMGKEFAWSIGIVGILVFNNYSRYIFECIAFVINHHKDKIINLICWNL